MRLSINFQAVNSNEVKTSNVRLLILQLQQKDEGNVYGFLKKTDINGLLFR